MDDLNSPLLAELLKEIKAIKWSKFPLYFLVGESDVCFYLNKIYCVRF